MTPYEDLYDKKPNVNLFKVFDYLVYAHVVDEVTRNIDPKSEECVFIGYYENTKAYRMYNLKIYKVVV